MVRPSPARSADRGSDYRIFRIQKGFPGLFGKEPARERENDQSHDAANGKDAFGKASQTNHGLNQSGKKQIKSRSMRLLFFSEKPEFDFVFRPVKQALDVLIMAEKDDQKN